MNRGSPSHQRIQSNNPFTVALMKAGLACRECYIQSEADTTERDPDFNLRVIHALFFLEY